MCFSVNQIDDLQSSNKKVMDLPSSVLFSNLSDKTDYKILILTMLLISKRPFISKHLIQPISSSNLVISIGLGFARSKSKVSEFKHIMTCRSYKTQSCSLARSRLVGDNFCLNLCQICILN